MAKPTTRAEFKEYCLRDLGKPVIEINVDDDQVDDRIDQALAYYWDYHFDGSELTYYKHQITSDNITNKYITLPENIIGAVNIFPIGDPSMAANDIFNIRYQIALNDLYTLTSVSMVPYYMAMQHIATVADLLVGQQPVRYSRHKDRLYIDMDWSKVTVGEFLIVQAYEVIDPDVYPDAWSDRWLALYATALIKRQWGNNLKKFAGMQLPGGVSFNGQQIYDEAVQEIKELEADMVTNLSMPAMHMIG